ncbi:MAG: hypothetical protein LBN10_02860 [Propionibacteriaceae bacterium]|nr:hypothetical protein [Propionibacteriaceae bacterium]
MSESWIIDGAWTVAPADNPGDTVPAQVPGVVHEALVAAGRLENPYASNATATAAHQVSATDWVYRVTFDLPEGADPDQDWEVVAPGVDTFATFVLNSVEIGRTENAMRTYVFQVAPGVLQQTNELTVLIQGHEQAVADMIPEARARLGHQGGIETKLGKSLIRRYQRSFFSDTSLLNLGTGVLGLGLTRPLSLRRVQEVEVTGVWTEVTAIDTDGNADVVVHVSLNCGEWTPESLWLSVALNEPGESVPAARTGNEVLVSPGAATYAFRLEVPSARLWWPRGYGEAFLYQGLIEVSHRGEIIASAKRDIGLRQVELRLTDPVTGRPTFEFVINSTPIYARGTNLVALDYLKVYADKEAYQRLFTLIENGNNTMIRMWGGGMPETEDFYAECDRRGLLIWQDCYLHSNTYPDYDEAWVENFKAEVVDLITTVRQHASLVIFAGGNEQYEGWQEWGWKDSLEYFFGERLFSEVIPEILEQVPTGVPYITNSPHDGPFAQSPVEGDSHTWGHFFNATKDPVFVSETCWSQSTYSRPETLKEVMGLDVDDFTGSGWAERWKDVTTLDVIKRFPYTSLHTPGGLRAYLNDLEIEQAEADYHAIGWFRLRSPSNRGVLYWSLNKGGPLFQFGAIDYGLRPLMSHYVLARLYRDVVVGVYRDLDDVAIVASNATGRSVAAILQVRHVDSLGQVIQQWERDVTIAPGSPQSLLRLDRLYASVRDRHTESVHVRLIDASGRVLSSDRLIFAPLAEYTPASPQIDSTVEALGDGRWQLRLSAQGGVATLVRLEDDQRLLYSDNYFPLIPGFDASIVVESTTPTAWLTLSTWGDTTTREIELA